ncbi:MAG: hypothetical protein KDA57_16870, partial [Planctomycetales bacterium]|nr:hypothetical protein [Planctomycetales bacterium]
MIRNVVQIRRYVGCAAASLWHTLRTGMQEVGAAAAAKNFAELTEVRFRKEHLCAPVPPRFAARPVSLF